MGSVYGKLQGVGFPRVWASKDRLLLYIPTRNIASRTSFFL